ncbi:hypothetical protein ACT6QG_14470 [Xanthobacter sp. TB0136]|uniref:hypothetical protein n=1 Tax=Xanthobacter sp. TB0136 TaxID=3459177 RepID=UPI0040398A78
MSWGLDLEKMARDDEAYYEKHRQNLLTAEPLPPLGQEQYAEADAFISQVNAEARGWRMTPLDELGSGVPPVTIIFDEI